MNVRLVNHTPNPEEFIVYVARVSNPDNQGNPEIAKLVRYLIRNKHWSPLEHAFFTFEIKTSRAIAQQIVRHRSFSFQEFSQRYSEVTEIEPIELRRQAIKNRQSSEEVFDPVVAEIRHERDWDASYVMYASELINDVVRNAKNAYHKLINAGVAKESARLILPLATSTTLYMSGSVRSWIHYLQLRNDDHAQKEHQLIAQQIEDILRRELPITFTALDDIRQANENHDQILRILKNHGMRTADDLLAALLTSPVGHLRSPESDGSIKTIVG
jgi:thymidylate synthase (FAD)